RKRHPRLHRAHLGDDGLGDRLRLRQRHEGSGLAARDPREGEVLAVGRGAQALDDLGDPVKIRKIERRVGTERQPDTVRGERNAAYQIEYRRAQPPAAGKAMIDGDFEGVETTKVLARPTLDGRTKTYANRGRMPMRRHQITTANAQVYF